MPQFKHRPNKLKYLSTSKTLDEYHKDHMNKMASSYKELEYISKTGDLIIDYYEKISGIHYDTNLDNDDEPIFINTNELRKRIADSEQEIYQKNEQESEQGFEQETEEEIYDPEKISIDPSQKLKLLNLLSQKNRKAKKPIKKRKMEKSNPNCTSILNFFQPEEIPKEEKVVSLNRAELQDKFLFIIDKNYACTKVKNVKTIFCSQCNIEKTLFPSDGCYICQRCGETDDNIIMENESSNHKEMTSEKQKYPYKKINHLKEKLNQFQSKETADVPEEVYEIIFRDLKKMRIYREDTTPFDIRVILKKHRQTVYYEHLQQIYCKITNCAPITLTRDTEETIISMFQKMQDAFQTHRPDDRSNFLSYAYVLNKLFRIIGLEKHSKFFYLLKSKDKLRDQDNIWSKICRDMGWRFFSSF